MYRQKRFPAPVRPRYNIMMQSTGGENDSRYMWISSR
jgi:hypothetical protein